MINRGRWIFLIVGLVNSFIVEAGTESHFSHKLILQILSLEFPEIRLIDWDVETMLRFHFDPQIRSERFELLFARDGHAARRLLEERPAISLVFVDINMPGLDGLELVEAIRRGAAGDDGAAERRLVMLTAYGDAPNLRKAMRAGANDYLSKPIDFKQMEQVIDEHLHGGRAGVLRRSSAFSDSPTPSNGCGPRFGSLQIIR